MLFTHYATLFGSLMFSLPSVAAQKTDDLSWVSFDRQQFNGSAPLDDKGDVQLFWKTGDNYSTFGIASRSSGYLALGFSETGAMTGADMAIGYTGADGKFVFENRHAGGFVTPQVSEDQKDNMRLKESHQANGVTSFVFEKRNTAACIQEQMNVMKDAWQWFIYAHSSVNTFAQHAPGNMGKQYIKLGSGKTVSVNEVRPVADTKNLTITQPEMTVPVDETTYCYTLHKLPAGKKNYIVGERPIQSSELMHHLVIYACYNLADEYLDMVGKEPNCDWKTFSNPCNGFVTEWAPGMSGKTYEAGYGKPFGSDYYEYVMFEVHYNNPKGIEGTKDIATYDLVYTEKPVDVEIGSLTLGDLQVSGWFLEPGKELVAHSTVCTPECTGKWPKEGITAISVFHHMHYRGRNARVQVIRDGKEIEPLSSLYDFEYGYQFSKNLNSIQLLPGDKFITTCEYNTMNDTEPVPGGQPSEDEMCFAWVDYYPANQVLACTQIDMGSDPKNPINGTNAMCLEKSSEQPDIYPSKFLNSTFQALPASGDQCPATYGNQTGTPSGQAAVISTCPETDVCFALNVPEVSASSGSGPIYFQLTAPTSYSWVALAQGTMMSNANMFLMYSSADGNNITLSARTTTGHNMPTHDDTARYTLLDGSGVSNGKMTANVRCDNCDKWSTGSMNLKGGSSDWMYAYLPGAPINSDDTNAMIQQHAQKSSFQWDLSKATGGSEPNPFTAAASTTTSSTSNASGWQMLSSYVQDAFRSAHGALASIAFLVIFPFGAMLVRLANFRGVVWTHGGLQIFGLVVFIAAAGLGIFMADGQNYLSEPHAVIGLLLLGVFCLMPFFGALHHKFYQQVRERTWVSYTHIFTGRAGVILGMVNGGLGLSLADADNGYIIGYSVVAGVVGIAYIAVVIFGEIKRGRNVQVVEVGRESRLMSEPKHSDRDSSRSHRT